MAARPVCRQCRCWGSPAGCRWWQWLTGPLWSSQSSRTRRGRCWCRAPTAAGCRWCRWRAAAVHCRSTARCCVGSAATSWAGGWVGGWGFVHSRVTGTQLSERCWKDRTALRCGFGQLPPTTGPHAQLATSTSRQRNAGTAGPATAQHSTACIVVQLRLGAGGAVTMHCVMQRGWAAASVCVCMSPTTQPRIRPLRPHLRQCLGEALLLRSPLSCCKGGC